MGNPYKKIPLDYKLFKPVVKNIIIKGEYKQGEKTHPAYKQLEDKDYIAEKKRLFIAIHHFVEAGEEHATLLPHPFFWKNDSRRKRKSDV